VAKLGDIEQAVLDIFYEQTVHQATPVTPLRPLLTSLKRRGLKLGLSTMDNTESAKECMRALGVFDLMDFICGYDAGFGAKPDPGMALAFAEAIEHPIDQVMMVGDALVDFQMARSAGCSVTVGVLTGAASRQELSPHADHVIAHIGELPQLLDQLS
jgi:phosphoglycolate phosphatase